MGTFEIVLIAVAAALGVAALIYGFIRKASRTSWIGWQVLLLFALTFLLDVIPLPQGMASLWIVAGAFAGLLGLDLLLGGLLRAQVMKCDRPNKHAVRLSRVLGALCALCNVALLAGMIGSLVLAVCYALPAYPAFLSPVYASAVWQSFLSRHVYDLFVLAVLFVFTRSGLRMGLLKGLYYLLMFALTLASFIGAILLATKVPVISGWGDWLAARFGGLAPAAASVLGHGIFALVFGMVMFAVVMLIGALLHKGVRRMLDSRALGMISSVVLFLIYLFVFFAVMCSVYYGIAQLAARGAQNAIGLLALRVERVVTSSPLSAVVYRYNPFVLLLH